MPDLFFFTDPTTLAQTGAQVFGPVADFNNKERFRVTSIHSSNTKAMAIAMVRGRIAAQKITIRQDGDATLPNANLMSLILKPTNPINECLDAGLLKDSKISIPSIKYIIYKGIKNSSILASDGVSILPKSLPNQPATNNLVNKANDIKNKNNTIFTGASGPPSSSILKLNDTSADTASIDNLFYQPAGGIEMVEVLAGEWIGDFDQTKFGIDIIFDEIRSNTSLEIARTLEYMVKVPYLPATPTASDILEYKTKKEEILSFIDPTAFWGMMYGSQFLYYKNAANTDVRKQSVVTVGNGRYRHDVTLLKPNFYDIFFTGLHNRNVIYVDIRNEFNRSFNYLGNFNDTINLKIGNGATAEQSFDYYNKTNYRWPIMAITQPALFTPAENNTGISNLISISVQIPLAETQNPMWVIDHGYKGINATGEIPKIEENERFVDITRQSDSYSVPLDLYVYNLFSNATTTTNNTVPVTTYIRLYLIRADIPSAIASSGIVHRPQTHLDNIFLPYQQTVPLASTTPNALNVRVCNEKHFTNIQNIKSVNSVGVAYDSQLVTFFAVSSFREVPLYSAPASITSIYNTVTTPYFEYLSQIYPRIDFVEGTFNISGTTKNYVRILDTNPSKSNTIQTDKPALDKELVAIIIKKTSLPDKATFIQNSGASDKYDIFLKLELVNSGIDTNGKPYSAYKIMLQGYAVSSGNVDVQSVPNYLKDSSNNDLIVYGYEGANNTLILQDPTINFNLKTDDGLPCSLTSFTQKQLEYLEDFIDEIQTGPNNGFKQNQRLYETVFLAGTPHGFRVDNNNGTRSLVAPTAGFNIDSGFLAEACQIFAMWCLDKDIKLWNDHDTQQQAAVNLSSPIFEELVKVLVKHGFTSTLNATTLKQYNTVINHKTNLITTTVFQNGNQITQIGINERIADIMSNYNNASGTVIYQKTIPPANINNAGKVDVNYQKAFVTPILKDITDEVVDQLNKLKECFWKIFNTAINANFNKPLPESIAVAVGDGSGTRGLTNILSEGLILFSYDYNTNGAPSTTPKSIKRFSARSKSVLTNVHLTIFGVDTEFTASTVDVVINDLKNPNNTSVCRFTVAPTSNDTRLFPEYCIGPVLRLTTQNALNLPARTTNGTRLRIFNGAPPANGDIDPNKIIEFINGNGVVVATYDGTNQNLIINNRTNTDLEISVEVTSGTVLTNRDEIQTIICVVDGRNAPVHFPLIVNNQFQPDYFELTKSIKQDIRDKAENRNRLKEILNEIFNGALGTGSTFDANKVTIQLVGSFIGKLKNPLPQDPNASMVERDIAYLFNRPKNSNERDKKDDNVHRVNEYVAGLDIPPAAPILAPLRTSAVNMVLGENVLGEKSWRIEIESFVDYSMSRLDRKVFTRLNIDPTDTNLQVVNNVLNPLTLALTPNTTERQTDAVYRALKMDDNTGTVFDDNVPIYNPILSALRSIGTLEAIFDIMVSIAAMPVANGGLEKTSQEVTALRNKLNVLLSNASVSKNLVNGIAANITYDIYNDLKHYVAADHENGDVNQPLIYGPLVP